MRLMLENVEIRKTTKGAFVQSLGISGFVRGDSCSFPEGMYKTVDMDVSFRPRPSGDGRFVDYVVGFRRVIDAKK